MSHREFAFASTVTVKSVTLYPKLPIPKCHGLYPRVCGFWEHRIHEVLHICMEGEWIGLQCETILFACYKKLVLVAYFSHDLFCFREFVAWCS